MEHDKTFLTLGLFGLCLAGLYSGHTTFAFWVGLFGFFSL